MAQPTFSPGMFVWRELMTGDDERARRFYGELLGWTWKGEEMGADGTYWIASRDGRQLCGAMRTPPGAQMPAAWSSYVLVDDVDAAASRCTAAGGRVLRAPADIPDVGRFAVISDPWGAVVFPFRASGGPSEPPPFPPPVGTFCWETLVTPDPSKAIAFYGKVVGFGTGATPSGEGKVFTAGSAMVADIQPARPGAPSYWATYVRVDAAEATRDRAVRLGGRVIVPRVDVPKVGIVSFVADPTGASLGLFQQEGTA
jgi:predicted enzyme related to lactoylglutathione lyase